MKLHDAEKELARMLSQAMPVDQHVRVAALCRPVGRRTVPPQAGALVWYRHEPFGELTQATVERVDDANPRDTYVWRNVIDPTSRGPLMQGGQYVMEQVEDPWPDVYMLTRWGRVVTREARIEGSPGWLPYP